MLSPLDKLLYSARQGVRVAWYMGHYLASRPEIPPRRHEGEVPRRSGPTRERLYGDIARLFASDLANAEAGHYPLPRDHDGPFLDRLARSRAFFADLPKAHERMAEGRADEVRVNGSNGLPDYFLQNFHFQTGGYLTEESARLYDMQVEVLFSGTANAMRRHCLVPLAGYLKGRDQRVVRLLDVACGTGRFLRSALEAWPRLDARGIDLSEAYVAEARRYLADYPRAGLQVANAEALPFADRSINAVSAIYLFHELPPKVRRTVAAEFSRVLKPGGLLVFMDSLQIGDTEAYDGLLEAFPERFHEPYYAGYLREDLPALFGETGLKVLEEKPVFLSKLVVAEKQGTRKPSP